MEEFTRGGKEDVGVRRSALGEEGRPWRDGGVRKERMGGGVRKERWRRWRYGGMHKERVEMEGWALHIGRRGGGVGKERRERGVHRERRGGGGGVKLCTR